MNLPRIILADETRPGKLPSGVLIVCALKELGYKLRVFVGGVDEASLSALRIVCDQPITLLDPLLCESEETLRWLFETAASPDALNVVITSLGSRWTEDSPFRVSKECCLLAKYLACELVPIVYSDMSSAMTMRTLREAIRQISEEVTGDLMVRSVIFKSVLNEREYQLADKDLGRTFSAMSIGSLPRMTELNEPIVTDLCVRTKALGALKGLIGLSRALADTKEHLDWPLFYAMASAEEWEHQPPVASPIKEAGKFNVAVIRDDALALGGDGTEHLLRALGANIVDVPLDGETKHRAPIHGIYIPHGLSYLVLTKIHANVYVKTLISRCANGDSFVLAEGGSAALLGDRITLPRGAMGGADGRGFAALPFSTSYSSMSYGSPQRGVAQSRRPNPLIHGSQEWVWGYKSRSVYMTSERDMCWSISSALNVKDGVPDGMANRRVLATTMRVEPWSSPEYFKRWLEGEDDR